MSQAVYQSSFFTDLTRATGCGALFDISNAVVADGNGGEPLTTWATVLESTNHFHVAGFARSHTEPSFLVDSHDQMINPETLKYISQIRSRLKAKPNATVVIERDVNFDFDSITQDCRTVRELL
jgi:uncharacterized protein (UPF0276 family)